MTDSVLNDETFEAIPARELFTCERNFAAGGTGVANEVVVLFRAVRPTQVLRASVRVDTDATASAYAHLCKAADTVDLTVAGNSTLTGVTQLASAPIDLKDDVTENGWVDFTLNTDQGSTFPVVNKDEVLCVLVLNADESAGFTSPAVGTSAGAVDIIYTAELTEKPHI